MVKRQYSLITIALLIVLSLMACSEKSFYDIGSGWDYYRFPLIEPYYAIQTANADSRWYVQVYLAEPEKKNFLVLGGIYGITKIAVANGIIMIYSPGTNPVILKDGSKANSHWFIINPGIEELGFETEEEYKIILKNYGIDQQMWQTPDDYLQIYDKTRCLSWIPGCE